MKKWTKILVSAFMALAALFMAMPHNGIAIPAFARNYSFNCNMCHTAFPKLNDFGQRLRDNGYQVPGHESFEKTVFDTSIPFAIRTTPGMSLYSTDQGTDFGFNILGFDLLAGGVLHKNISFMFIYAPRIDLPSGDQDGLEPSQLAALESASIVFSNIFVKGAFNLRIGKFEPSYLVTSLKRSFFIRQPYEIYDFTSPQKGFLLSDNQLGVELTGHFKGGFKYGLGVINGTGAIPDSNTYKDLYVSLVQVLGGGDGQSAGQRIGLFGCMGWQPTRPGDVISPTGEANGSENKQMFKFGGDISLNFKSVNLAAFLMMGIDDGAFNTLRPEKPYYYYGGYARVDWAALADNRLVTSLLYNFVRPPSYDKERTIDSVSALLRYYFGNWTAINVALHGEYTFKMTGKDTLLKEHIFSLLIDLAV